MLRVKVYINEEQIQYIEILNMGTKIKGETEYKVQTGVLKFFTIYHKREDGWKILLTKVLKAMNN